jgi:hypothetical protein
VESTARGMAKAFDFIFQHKLAALDFDDLRIVGGEMLESIVELIFQDFVFSFQFNKMGLYRHNNLLV